MNTPDAATWAEAFIQAKLDNNWSRDDIDKELMISWFANYRNAIDTGHPSWEEWMEYITVEDFF